MTTMLPLAIDLQDRLCVCVGAGTVAARRVPAMLAAGARVRVIAPELHPDLAATIAGPCEYLARAFQSGDTAGAFLVLAATGVRGVDEMAAAEALSTNALVCVASEPALGNCHFMSTVQRGSLTVALHTGGAAPAVSAAIRRVLEDSLPDRLGETLDALADLRRLLREQVTDPDERARRWRTVTESGALDAALREGRQDLLPGIRGVLLGT